MFLERYIKGGPDIQEARAWEKRLGKKSTLSSGDKTDLARARVITRRHFLARVRDAAALTGAVLITGGGIITSETCFQDEASPNPEKASALRLKIHKYEERNRDIVNEATVTEILDMVKDLYRVTFGRERLDNKLIVATPENLKKLDPNAPLPDAPSGLAGIVIVKFDRDGKIQGFDDIPLLVYTGKDTAKDPNVNKLSVMRALLIHEFIHTQTHPRAMPDTGFENVGRERVSARYVRGLKWVGPQGEPAWFLEELNTQILSEYTNDPSGQDPIWQQIKESDLYRQSFDAAYFLGEEALAEIYKKLGITIKDIEDAHFRAKPKEFLELLDRNIAAMKIILPEPASSIFIKLNIKTRPIAENPNQYIQPLLNLKNAVVNSTP